MSFPSVRGFATELGQSSTSRGSLTLGRCRARLCNSGRRNRRGRIVAEPLVQHSQSQTLAASTKMVSFNPVSADNACSNAAPRTGEIAVRASNALIPDRASTACGRRTGCGDNARRRSAGPVRHLNSCNSARSPAPREILGRRDDGASTGRDRAIREPSRHRPKRDPRASRRFCGSRSTSVFVARMIADTCGCERSREAVLFATGSRRARLCRAGLSRPASRLMRRRLAGASPSRPLMKSTARVSRISKYSGSGHGAKSSDVSSRPMPKQFSAKRDSRHPRRQRRARVGEPAGKRETIERLIVRQRMQRYRNVRTTSSSVDPKLRGRAAAFAARCSDRGGEVEHRRRGVGYSSRARRFRR